MTDDERRDLHRLARAWEEASREDRGVVGVAIVGWALRLHDRLTDAPSAAPSMKETDRVGATL